MSQLRSRKPQLQVPLVASPRTPYTLTRSALRLLAPVFNTYFKIAWVRRQCAATWIARWC